MCRSVQKQQFEHGDASMRRWLFIQAFSISSELQCSSDHEFDTNVMCYSRISRCLHGAEGSQGQNLSTRLDTSSRLYCFRTRRRAFSSITRDSHGRPLFNCQFDIPGQPRIRSLNTQQQIHHSNAAHALTRRATGCTLRSQ